MVQTVIEVWGAGDRRLEAHPADSAGPDNGRDVWARAGSRWSAACAE